MLLAVERPRPWRDLAIAVAVQAARFALIVALANLLPLLGVSGWAIGFVVNIGCAIYAVALMSVSRLWRSSGMLTLWRSRTAFLWLLPFIAEALVWALPSGLVPLEPGFGWWAATLLLVGLNEELVSRGVVLSVLRRSWSPTLAVVFSAILFGLQHLSALLTTSRDPADVAGNVALSAVYGFALAAFQLRFAWLWPLVLVHATSDFTTILVREPVHDAWYVVGSAAMLAVGVLLVRRSRAASLRR